jgi:hypothetical protein
MKKSRKWSAASKAKAAATRAANKAKISSSSNPQDALAYLLKAERALLAGKVKRVGAMETYMLLALNALRGEL